MNSSLSWNDVVNPCFDWLPERREWSCPLGPVRLRWLLILIWDIDHVLFFHFKNRPKRTQKRNLANNHIHLTLPQYAYIPGTSYLAKLRVLSGRGNGRDRARQTTPSVEQAIGIQYLSASELDNVLGKSVQLHKTLLRITTYLDFSHIQQGIGVSRYQPCSVCIAVA